MAIIGQQAIRLRRIPLPGSLTATDCEGEVEPNEKCEVGRDGMNLSLRYPDGNRVILLPMSDREFFIREREDTRVVFHYTQQHLLTGYVDHQFYPANGPEGSLESPPDNSNPLCRRA